MSHDAAAARCPACASALAAEATHCAACGIAFARPEDSGPRREGAPGHVDLLFGAVPTLVAGSDATDHVGTDDIAEREVPVAHPAPAARRGGPPRWMFAVVLVVLVALVARRLLRAPDEDEVRSFEAFLGAAAFDADPADAVLPPLDPEARLRGIQAEAPDVSPPVVPGLPAAGTVSVHDFCDVFVAALMDIDPWTALDFGRHPHPQVPAGGETARRIASLRLHRDALLEVRRWPDESSSLTPHERIDLAVLRDWCEDELRWGLGTDHDRLLAIDWHLERLTWLRDVECCDVASRAAAAAAVLEATEIDLPEEIARLRTPARAEVLAVARSLEIDRGWLATYAETWDGLDAASAARLAGAARRARAAAGDAVAALRDEVLARATGSVAIGRRQLAERMRSVHRLSGDVSGVYARAFEMLRAAEAEMKAIEGSTATQSSPPSTDDGRWIETLRRRMTAWVPSAPEEPGLTLAPARDSMEHRALALYIDAGPLAPGLRGAVHVEPIPPARDDAERATARLRRAHVLAHETYPGHRMDALHRAASCTVRRCWADRGFAEGWATYAQDLIHETGDCAPGALDAWVRALERWELAKSAMIEILLATGAADGDAVLRLWNSGGSGAESDADIADLGAIALRQGDSLLYILGRDAILDLRAAEERRLGGSFDLRDFHRRLLAEGPVPTALVAEAWAPDVR